ncbi:MAG: ferrochelatase [Ilumatobacteraceae bacterium]
MSEIRMNETRTAVLLMAYGTPRTPDEILPYYTDIRRGRVPTDEQLADLTRRYDAIGGISPLAQRTEAQRDALQAALDAAAPGQYFVTLGLKHAAPMIETAVEDLADAGFRRIVGLVLAPHFSSFSIGQYMDRAEAAATPHGITVTRITSWATEPAFIDFIAADLRRRLDAMPANTKVLFTAHSLPQRIIDAGDPYPDELRATAELVAMAVGLGHWSRWAIAWQSAGRTPEPWIGPDILQVINELGASENASGVLVSAVGFVADHLEVLYDLDIEATHLAHSLGLAFDRTACVNDDPTVMSALAMRVIGADASRPPA